MKLLNKGHELDKYAEALVQEFQDKKENIYIFGAGLIGEDIRAIIEKWYCFAGYIDNDRNKQRSGVNKATVVSLQNYIKDDLQGIIVIAADTKNIPVIEDQLKRAGLIKEKDFYDYIIFMKKIFPILSVYAYNKLYVEVSQICLTERCSLKCQKCAHACYAVDFKNLDMDMDIEMAKKSADSFFRYVDLIREFVLIGGEPFLYQNLSEIVEYIGETYRNKIVIFSIATNGTIIPKQSVLELCRKYDVTIRISDYSVAIKSLKKKYEQLQKMLKENRVLYTISDKNVPWMDYGFEEVNRKWNQSELIEVFERCKTPCREIRGSHYHYCVMARSVPDNLNMDIGKNDYLDIEELKADAKKVLLEFQMGYLEKGYLDMCNYCNGADAVNHPIPVAEQVKIERTDQNLNHPIIL